MIYYLGSDHSNLASIKKSKLGRLAEDYLELSSLGVTFEPGFIISFSNLAELDQVDLKKKISLGLSQIENNFKTQPEEIVLYKLTLSSDLTFVSATEIEYLGLTSDLIKKLADLKGKATADSIISHLKSKYSSLFKKNFELSGDILEQIVKTINLIIKTYYSQKSDKSIPSSIIFQQLIINRESIQGEFFTRDIITGEKSLDGTFILSENNSFSGKLEESHLGTQTFNGLINLSQVIEAFYSDVYQLKFIIRSNDIIISRLNPVFQRSIRSKIRLLGDLLRKNQISEEAYIEELTVNEIKSLLHPNLDYTSLKNIKSFKGGISGSEGAATGRVFFSTEKLIKIKGEDQSAELILIKKATYAEDVQAIEASRGVITSYGGYGSHAPVICRCLGKPALIIPNIQFRDNQVWFENHQLNEGDYISMEVSENSDPLIYFGKGNLDKPDLEDAELKMILATAIHFKGEIEIMANADSPEDVALSMSLGADGIGLCRTEHFFTKDDRIQYLRQFLISDHRSENEVLLKKLQDFFQSDLLKMFAEVREKPLTVRLLDAPLHEFIPESESEIDKMFEFLRRESINYSKENIINNLQRLREINPMLGHRGGRIGLTFPEIYEIQTSAILNATWQSQNELNILPRPRIMIPFVMNVEEFSILKNGKKIGKKIIKGIRGVLDDFLISNNLAYLPFILKIGVMIELPAAALTSDQLAKQAEFFSFGTNDLTQTTLGLSRDDAKSFFADYLEMEIWTRDPFQQLVKPVKDLICHSILAAKSIRPDMEFGICGEQGANPEDIHYLISLGINSISCSPYQLPVTLFTVAKREIESKKQ